MWEFYTVSRPKARKEHVCDDCGGVIATGERYERCDGKWEGDMSSIKSHLDCRECVETIYKEAKLMDDEGIHPSDFEEDDWIFLAAQMPERSARLRAAFSIDETGQRREEVEA